MKVWIKLLVGSLLGLALGFLLPHDNALVEAALSWAEALVIQIGRYALAPMLFFSLSVSVYELRQDRRMWALVFRVAAIVGIATAALIAVGLIAVITFPPARIPILIEGQKETIAFDLGAAVLALFPANAFSALVSDGSFLLPLCVLAFFLGAGLSYERAYSKTIIPIVDAMSRISFYVSSFFSEILGILMIVLGAFWAVRFSAAVQADVFRDLVILLAATALFLALGVLPLFLYLAGPKTNPWKQLYGTAAPALAAFFSGDINFALPVLLKQSKENHGVQRRANTVSLILFTAFGRAGSAMVAAVSLIVIIKSYSSLGVTLADLLSISLWTVVFSLFMSRHPGDGAYATLAVLCAAYGRGFEAGYLILKPIAFYLIAIGAFLDAIVAALGTYAVGRLCGFQEEKEARHFS